MEVKNHTYSVTVIIPTFNSSATIERCLKSVLNQTYPCLDVIVVDDGSIDYGLLEAKIDLIDDKRVKILRHKINRNGSAARNTGMLAATGEFISFLDSDDEWYPDHIETYLKKYTLFDKIEKGSNFLMYCKAKIYGVNHFIYMLPKHPKDQKTAITRYLFVQDGYITTCSFFFPKKIIALAKFNEDLIRHQDYDFLLQLERKGINFYYSDHLGVKIHWENNYPELKGGTWNFSLSWMKDNMASFDKITQSNFILKNVVWPLLKKKDRKHALKFLLKDCLIFFISLKRLYITARFFLFGN